MGDPTIRTTRWRSALAGTCGLLGALAGCGDDGGAPVDAAIDAAIDAPALDYRTFIMIERWIRSDPAAQHTIASPVTFHQDDPLPRYVDVDEHCGYHEGTWPGLARTSRSSAPADTGRHRHPGSPRPTVGM